MSEMQKQINNACTLIGNNSALLLQNENLLTELHYLSQSEIALGKSNIVEAINLCGGNATYEDSLATLADKILSLPVVSKDTVLDDTIQRPINIGELAANQGEGIIILSDEAFVEKSSGSKDSSIHAYRYNTTIQEINIPNAKGVGYEMFKDISNLRRLNILNAPTFIGRWNSSKLIDLIFGAAVSSNVNLTSVGYNPKEAYRKDSSSLVDEGETWNNNNEKWNHNLREHFAANLQDRTGFDTVYTITFGSTMLGLLEEATILAFTNKNWTLA